MVQLICGAFYFVIYPNLLFGFYSRCCHRPVRWYLGLGYTLLSAVLSKLELQNTLPVFLLLLLKVLLLSAAGIVFLKQKAVRSVPVAALSASVLCLARGAVHSAIYLALGYLGPRIGNFLKYMDIIEQIAGVGLFLFTALLVLKGFSGSIRESDDSALTVLAVPLFFIALAEQTITAYVYGDTIIWDLEEGLKHPLVNNGELMFLHICGYFGILAVLLSLQRLVRSFRDRQTIKLLEMQARAQEIYVREARSRYDGTRAFRHDVRNHLSVLRELLARGEAQKAADYLSELDKISEALSYPVQTGNASVDALLGSKLMSARQDGIKVSCSLKIPESCRITDIDWCIILSNAIDNAARAVDSISAGERNIHISSRLKGNLYLLHIENSCRKDAKYPEFGTGLTNIAAAVCKYDGTMDIEILDGIFSLDILFGILRQ